MTDRDRRRDQEFVKSFSTYIAVNGDLQKKGPGYLRIDTEPAKRSLT